MRNLAGDPESTAMFAEELSKAGVPIRACKPYDETETQVCGLLVAGAHTLTFNRGWVYTSVSVEPPFPLALALKIDRTPHGERGTRYSGTPGRLGAVARCHGFAGGPPPDEIFDGDPVAHYHIDTADGLRAFVAAVKANATDAAVTAAAETGGEVGK